MVVYDTSFEIESITSHHLRFEGRYWEEYKRDSGGVDTGRFEFHPGWQTVYATGIETPVTKVEFADGSIGWGEPNCFGAEIYCLLLDNFAEEMARGREFGHPLELWDFLYDAQRGRGYHSGYWLDALAGLDIAVWDAVGRREGVPVASMLGREVREELPVYLSGIRRATLRERIEYANEWVDGGLRGAKIFLNGDVSEGLAELEALQAGVHGMEKWMVDVLWMLRGDNAAKAKADFGDLGVEFLECPLQPEDLAGHRELWKQPGAPIALGEHFRTSYQVAEWLARPQSMDVYQPDIGRTGISDGLRQLAMAEEAGIPVTIHMGSGSAIFQAATLHFSAICRPTHLQEYQAGLTARTADAMDSAWQYADGMIRLPDAPGLGVDISEDWLEPFIVRR